jgi:hypothetical protein
MVICDEIQIPKSHSSSALQNMYLAIGCQSRMRQWRHVGGCSFSMFSIAPSDFTVSITLVWSVLREAAMF